MGLLETFEVMPVDVFVGGCGHVVLCQEHTAAKEEFYLRIMIKPEDAERVCEQIMASAKVARAR